MNASPPTPTRPRRGACAVASLAALARLAMARPGSVSTATLVHACALVRAALHAEEAYVVRAGDPHFIRVDSADDPTTYELRQKGYFLVWRELASNPQLAGGLFQVEDRRVLAPAVLAAAVPATHLALLLPSDESTAELLIVRGPWPAGLTAEQVDIATAARPMLACLVGTLLDTQRRERQQEQLHSLSMVAAALTRGQESTDALPAIATALAKASGFEWTPITLVDDRIEHVVARVVNHARHSETETAAESREGAWLRERALTAARHVAVTRRPLLYPNVFADGYEMPIEPELQRYFERSHILSSATFPLWSGDRLLGTLNFSASTPHHLDPPEVEFLALLCEQAVLALDWLTLHRELRDANAALARAATHDALTGLPNRVLFHDRLAQALARAQRTDGAVAVLFIDLDDFKAVNDSLGHEVGDRLLQVVAERLQRNLRQGDTVARMGGDEFTVVLADVVGETEAADVAERLRVAVRQPVELAGQQLTPTASIGVAHGAAAVVSAAGLLRTADLAMYQAKARGKARVHELRYDGNAPPRFATPSPATTAPAAKLAAGERVA